MQRNGQKFDGRIIVLSLTNLLGYNNHFANTQIRPLFTSFLSSPVQCGSLKPTKSILNEERELGHWRTNIGYSFVARSQLVYRRLQLPHPVSDLTNSHLYCRKLRLFSLWGRQSAQSCMTEELIYCCKSCIYRQLPTRRLNYTMWRNQFVKESSVISKAIFSQPAAKYSEIYVYADR